MAEVDTGLSACGLTAKRASRTPTGATAMVEAMRAAGVTRFVGVGGVRDRRFPGPEVNVGELISRAIQTFD